MKKQDGEMKKMKFSDEKKKAQLKKKSPHRPSIVSNYSVVSLSEVTEGSLQVWRQLPEKIRQDPSLASFRQEHERLHGECDTTNCSYFIIRYIHRGVCVVTCDVPSHMSLLITREITVQSNLLIQFQSSHNHFSFFLISVDVWTQMSAYEVSFS